MSDAVDILTRIRISRVGAVWRYYAISIILVLASARGFVVINTNLPANVVYHFSVACLMLFTVFGYLFKNKYKGPDYILLRNLIKLNLILGLINVVVDQMLGMPPSPGLVYLYLAPYVIFLFLRVPVKYLKTAIAFITIAIGYSVCANFIDTLSGAAGVQRVYEFNLKLRPDTFVALSRTGDYFRAAGYTGNYHDSANILGMAGVFYMVSFLVERKFSNLGMFLIAFLSLTLTQSAANIVVCIFVLVLFFVYIFIKSNRPILYLYVFFLIVSMGILVFTYGSIMGIFTSRVGAGGDWTGMFNQLDTNSLLMAIPYFVGGHAAGFGSRSINTEVALLGTVLQLGLLHSIIFFSLLCYPIVTFFRSKTTNIEALPSLAAIVFGVLSLIHYASLFRVTSIFLFYAFFALSIRKKRCCLKNSVNV